MLVARVVDEGGSRTAIPRKCFSQQKQFIENHNINISLLNNLNILF